MVLLSPAGRPVRGETGKVRGKVTLNGKGSLAVAGTFGLSPVVARLKLDAAGLELPPFAGYAPEAVQVSLTRGTVSAKGEVSVREAPDGALAFGWEGEAICGQVALLDAAAGQDLLSWDSLRFGGMKATSNPPSFVAGMVALTDFFARYVDGTEDPPLPELLASFGVAFHVRAAADAKDRGGKPGSGTPPRCTLGLRAGADRKLAFVRRDGPAARAGLSAGDTLVAVGGLKATPERIAAVLAQRAPGDVVEVHAFRRDEFMTFAVTPAPAPDDTCWLTLAADAAPEALARRRGWLGG